MRFEFNESGLEIQNNRYVRGPKKNNMNKSPLIQDSCVFKYGGVRMELDPTMGGAGFSLNSNLTTFGSNQV